MARPLDSASVDYSDYTDSVRTLDTLDDLLTRFTLEFKPDYVFKVRNRLGPLIVGMDILHSTEHKETQGAVMFKPTNQKQWWRRLRVDSTGGISLRSRKLQWCVFTVDLQAGWNALDRTTDASFRVATKWDLTRGQYHNKKKVALGDATEGRVHWCVNYSLPELAGSIGATPHRALSRDVQAELGYAHAEVARIELVVWPWRNNPKRSFNVESAVEVEEDAPARAAGAVGSAVRSSGGADGLQWVERNSGKSELGKRVAGNDADAVNNQLRRGPEDVLGELRLYVKDLASKAWQGVQKAQ